MPIIDRANAQIARLADGKSVRYININQKLALPGGRLREGMSNDGLHLTPRSYQVWADALKPCSRNLGPPASVIAPHRRRRPQRRRHRNHDNQAPKSVTIPD